MNIIPGRHLKLRLILSPRLSLVLLQGKRLLPYDRKSEITSILTVSDENNYSSVIGIESDSGEPITLPVRSTA